uniref:Uncharacterized protein n=1 Tax=Panagrolaimus sp. ES5 TaxID=591445 RepID=A0AC34GPE0_9BILA
MDTKNLKECEICGDDKDVNRHYGVVSCYGCKAFFRRSIFEKKRYNCKDGGRCSIRKSNRNKCRHCRFEKCLEAGMSEDSFRESHSYSSNTSKPASVIQSPINSPLCPVPSPRTLSTSSDTLINFLKLMTRSVVEAYDPKYENLNFEEIRKLPIGRHVSLSEGLKHPELVAPRVKINWKCERPAVSSELAFGWYQIFVVTADWARGIPQFRMLSCQDQERLFQLNFANISFPLLLYYFAKENLSFDKIPASNGGYVSPEMFESQVISGMLRKIIDIYYTHLIRPFMEVSYAIPDEEEVALAMTIMLFQFSEVLSNEGHVICKSYKEKLFSALFEYQLSKFPEKNDSERIQRYAQLLEMMQRVTKVWSIESDIHLILSTFDEMNIDGIPKDLLFNRFLTKTE